MDHLSGLLRDIVARDGRIGSILGLGLAAAIGSRIARESGGEGGRGGRKHSRVRGGLLYTDTAAVRTEPRVLWFYLPSRPHDTGRLALGQTGGLQLGVEWRLLLFFLDDRQIHVVILGLATNSQPPRLHVGEDDADELPKRCRIEDRDSFGSTSLCVAAVYAIAPDRAAALPTILPQPARVSQIKRKGMMTITRSWQRPASPSPPYPRHLRVS